VRNIYKEESTPAEFTSAAIICYGSKVPLSQWYLEAGNKNLKKQKESPTFAKFSAFKSNWTASKLWQRCAIIFFMAIDMACIKKRGIENLLTFELLVQFCRREESP
jgi:hypothetical protein